MRGLRWHRLGPRLRCRFPCFTRRGPERLAPLQLRKGPPRQLHRTRFHRPFPDSFEQVAHLGRSYIRCGQDRISVYLAPAAQYIQLDLATQTLTRWKVDQSWVVGSKSLGFAVTDEGKILAAFADYPDSQRKLRHGLYELKATPDSPIASLTPVEGTVTVFDPNDGVPDCTIEKLWGADGNSLVLTRHGEPWAGQCTRGHHIPD